MRTKSKQFSSAMRKRFERDFRAQCLQAAGTARLIGLQDVAEYLAFIAMDDLAADHTAAHYAAQRVKPAQEKALHSAPESAKIMKKAERQEETNMKKIKVWAFTANGIGWNGPVTMYFDSRENAEAAWNKYTYADDIHFLGTFSADKFEAAYPLNPGETVHNGELYPCRKSK